MNQSVNKVLRTRPADPLSSIASQLLGEAKNSVPVIERIVAKKTILQETPTIQALKLQVYMNYQGRSDMRFEHILTFDQDEHEKQFLYDNKADKTGLDAAIRIINGDICKLVAGVVVEGLASLDKKLIDYFQKKNEANPEEIGTNITKIVSEGVLFAAASCF